MKVKLIVIGKTEQSYLKEGILEYEKRILHYVPFETIVIASLKKSSGLSQKEIKTREAEQMMKYILPSDFVVVLDEKGKETDSVGFSGFLNQRFSSGLKSMAFIIGGAYGVDDSIKSVAQYKLSLSKMTFSHQMVRLFFLEQFYRALTILNHESYHHD